MNKATATTPGTREITREGFIDLLSLRGGATPVTVLTVTEPRLKKTGNPFVGVTRETRRNGFVGGSYESIANNKREREGEARDFEAHPLPWGRHYNRYFIEHKGSFYLKVFPVTTGVESVDIWRDEAGNVLSVDDLKPFFPKKSENRGNVEWRTVKVDNIYEITLDGERLRLVNQRSIQATA